MVKGIWQRILEEEKEHGEKLSRRTVVNSQLNLSCSSSFARTVVRALSVRFPTFDVMSGRVHTSFRALPALRHVLHRQVLSSVDRAQLLFRSTLG